VFFIFSTITIVIAFIGLYGMLSFIIVTKTKEIGIRKVLGATIVQITKLLPYEFILLVGIASIIAVPVTWYAAANWLQRFAYRIQVSPIVFIITALFAIILTLLTVGIQAIRAASANPVESLRTE
jgi:putative ABC transport system permease protein